MTADNKENTTAPIGSAENLTDEELRKFATGSSSEGNASDVSVSNNSENTGDVDVTSEENPAVEITNEIFEKCPIKAAATRGLVKYGSFRHDTYSSTTCGMERGVSILLPDDYSEDKMYPVLYLLHGIFGDEYSFSNDSSNKIKEIVVNAYLDGIIEQTIVVCPNMYATSDPELKPGFNAESIVPYDNFVNDLVADLMPYIESTYSVKTGRENTALAGFSMGGREVLYISHCHPELFAYVGSISAAPGLTPGKDWAMEHVGSITEDELRYADDAIIPDVLLLCCGTKDSVVGTFPLSYHNIMERNGVDHIWYEITGADHDNSAIKSGLYNLLMQMAWSKSNK